MSSVTPPHYVRLKRYKLTLFIHCDVNVDTVQVIKERYEKLTGQTFYTVQLYLGRQKLDNFSTLYNCGIENEDGELVVVHSKGPKNDGTGDYFWETVEEAMSPPHEETEGSQSNKVYVDSVETFGSSEQKEKGADVTAPTRVEDVHPTFVGSSS